VQLKVLLLRLTKSHDDQESIDKAQHEKLLIALEQQGRDTKEQHATVEKQAAEIVKVTAVQRLIDDNNAGGSHVG
jgi:hypothetical protein